jgi:hypothetical protein
MVCLCKSAMAQLQLALPQLDVSASVEIAAAADIGVLAGWLAQFGLPAAPWEPDIAWLDVQLPTISLSASAMATLSAFAQLRAMALALGLDLLVPTQALAFTRLVATLDARLSAMLSAMLSSGASPLIDASAWMQLSATLTATAQVEAALQLGLFPQPPPGPPLALWRPFLASLRPLLPMIAITGQLGISLSADLAIELGAMLRPMLQIQLPPMPAASLSLMASLTASLAAIAQIGLSLGIAPLEVGLPEVRLMVAARVSATVSAIEASLGLSLPNLLAILPQIPYCPTLMAPPAVVSAAMSLNLPALNWQVPVATDLPVLRVGLPSLAFAAQLNAALGISAALGPCPICDAAALLGALL